MKTIDLLNNVKQTLNITSDLELAKALGTGKSRVCHWKTGRNKPDEYICFRIAEILNVEPQAVISAVRLDGSSTPEERGFWEGYAKRYGMLAVTPLVLAGTLAITTATYSPAINAADSINNTMYYAYLEIKEEGMYYTTIFLLLLFSVRRIGGRLFAKIT
jgi:transcriptional regulator with XRE-family HTH domain